jgi:hypothetical protein
MKCNAINIFMCFEISDAASSARIVGNFRQATADAWISVFDPVPMQLQAAAL